MSAVTAVDGRLMGARDVELYWQGWLPQGAPLARVVIVHGVSEHGARYGPVAERLVSAGFGVYAVDHRGHGRAHGRRAVVDGLALVADDLDTFVHSVVDPDAESRVFMLGHSMGGCIALIYALQHQAHLAGLVLSAPFAMSAKVSPTRRLILTTLASIAPGLGVLALDPQTISRDPDRVREYEADPLVFHGKLPAKTVVALTAAVKDFPDEIPTLTLPLLVLHGTADRIVPPASGRMVYERAGSSDKQLKLYDGYYHELFNEPPAERAVVLDDVLAWLTSRA